jgi:hypothetical protein
MKMLFALETIGDPDDGMVSVYTGCVDGNGNRDVAVLPLSSALQKQGAVANEPPTAAAAPCSDAEDEAYREDAFR